MTRYKKYLKSIGFKFSEDYPYLPFDNYGTSPVSLEDRYITLCPHCILITTIYNVGTSLTMVEKDGSIRTTDID